MVATSKPPENSSIWKIEAGKLVVTPHVGQKRMFASKAQIIAVIAGAQSGKTTSGPIWLLKEIMDKGPGEYGVVSPTFPLMDKKCLPEFKRLFQDAMKLGTYVKTDKKFYFSKSGLIKLFGTAANPCAVVFCYAADPDSLESATFKAVWCDEAGQSAFKLDSYYAIRRRLAIHEGRMLITTTPYDLGWLKTKIHDPWKKGDPEIEVINFRSIDNPYFPMSVYLSEQKKMPPWKFDLFYNGIFTVPTGTIYDCFKSDVHMVERFPIPSHWKRIWGMDFGQANTACVKIAVNPDYVKGSTGRYDRKYYVYQTYRSGGKSVEDHILSLRAGDMGAGSALCFGGAKNEDEWRLKYGDAGFPIYLPTLNGVEEGIDCVYRAISTGELAIFSDLSALETELKTYARELDVNDEITDKIVNKNTFHRLDGLRYGVSELISNPGLLEERKIVSTWKEA